MEFLVFYNDLMVHCQMGGMGEERNYIMYRYVSKVAVKPARKASIELLENMKGRLRDKYGLKAEIYPVGSAKVNLVTCKEDDLFDVDFNLVFSGEFSKQQLQTLKPHVIDVLNEFAVCSGFSTGQDSTSAITYQHHDRSGRTDFHLDVGVIILKDGRNGYRLIHHKDTGNYVLVWSLKYCY